MTKEMQPEALAHKFHETYERLAPRFGYETRIETRAFTPHSANGRLMVAVCVELAADLHARVQELEAQLAAQRKPLTDEQIEGLPIWANFIGLWPESRQEITRVIERAHGIGEVA